MKKSAGLLMYRETQSGVEVYLAHPGGPFFRDKDDGFWTIPKGGVEAGEELLDSAVREFEEETGLKPEGPFIPLGLVRQSVVKTVYAWAFHAPCELPPLRSVLFELEWPPRSGLRSQFPEIDDAGFFSLRDAAGKIMPSQSPFIDRLVASLTGRGTSPPEISE